MKVKIVYKQGADKPYSGAVSSLGTGIGDATVAFGRLDDAHGPGNWCLGYLDEASPNPAELRPLALEHQAASLDDYLAWVETQVEKVEADGTPLSLSHRRQGAARAFSWDQLGLVDVNQIPPVQ